MRPGLGFLEPYTDQTLTISIPPPHRCSSLRHKLRAQEHLRQTVIYCQALHHSFSAFPVPTCYFGNVTTRTERCTGQLARRSSA